jgi:hypothetical protein
MPVDPAALSAAQTSRSFARYFADSAIIATGWGVLYVVIVYPQAMLALLALPLVWERVKTLANGWSSEGDAGQHGPAFAADVIHDEVAQAPAVAAAYASRG